VNSRGSNVRKSETVEVIQGDENVIETILSFISRADTGIDAFVDQTRPADIIDKSCDRISKRLG
jgi:hypothetical protein